MFEGVLVPIGIVFIVFYFLYKIIDVLSRRKERQMMIEKMAQHPDMATRMLENRMEVVKNQYNWLKPAGLVIGSGVGCILSCIYMQNMTEYGSDAFMTLMVSGAVLICGGLGMLGGFFIERRLRRNDRQEK